MLFSTQEGKQTEPFKCIACGICARKCPTGALQLINVPDAKK